VSLPFVSHSPCAIGALRERDWQMPVAPGLDPKAGLNLFDLSLLDGAPENGGTDTRFAPLPVVDEDARREVEEIIGDAEAYAELVAVFLQEGDETLSSLEDAVACGDAAAARRLSHTLKGSCSSIGVARIAEMLSAIETAARAGECDDDLTYRLRPEWSAVHAHLAPFAAPAAI
jgi:HPt (histidine-containing phosphotransfer) domain-containing protein